MKRGEYGFDGDFRVLPPVWQAIIAAAVLAVVLGFSVFDAVTGRTVPAVVGGLLTSWLVLTVVSYSFTSRVGKFRVWRDVLDGLGLRGDEDLLDLGCGRGAVLLAAAELLPAGHTAGIDLWRPDQTGNSPEATRRNAELEGVAARVAVHSGDITTLPFGDASFDVVVSSFVLHHIPAPAGRRKAIDEAVRVLRPGGRLVLADLGHTKAYLAHLRALGLADTARRNLGPRVWWGGPWFPSHLVTATKKPLGAPGPAG